VFGGANYTLPCFEWCWWECECYHTLNSAGGNVNGYGNPVAEDHFRKFWFEHEIIGFDTFLAANFEASRLHAKIFVIALEEYNSGQTFYEGI